MQPPWAFEGGPLHTCGLVTATFICSAFGNALQPISVLAWLQPTVSILAFEALLASKPSWAKDRFTWPILSGTAFTFVLGIGQTFAFAGVFAYPVATFGSLFAAWGFSMALSILQVMLAYSGSHLALHRWPTAPLQSLVFPCLFTASASIISLALSTFTSPANAALDFEPLRQLCGIWGLAGSLFLMTAISTNLALHAASWFPALVNRPAAPGPASSSPLANRGWRAAASTQPSASGTKYQQVPVSSEPSLEQGQAAEDLPRSSWQAQALGQGVPGTQGPQGLIPQARGWDPADPYARAGLGRGTRGLVAVSALALLLGGLLANADMFYQRDIRELAVPKLQVSCLVEEDAARGSEAWSRLWARTKERLAAGDHLILWAEESVDVRSEEEEQMLIGEAAQLMGSAPPGSTPLLGLSYQKLVAEHGKFTNHFMLLDHKGQVAWNYVKAYPVPVVEGNIGAGPASLPLYDSPFGRLSGAICFDYDHPMFMLQAAWSQVDMMLQPSWTWGSIGPRHMAGNAIRAIEGGFTIIRCSSEGVSGVVSPRGKITTQTITTASDLAVFYVPREPRRVTLYSRGGFTLEWANVIVAAALWVVLLWVSDARLAAALQWARGVPGLRACVPSPRTDTSGLQMRSSGPDGVAVAEEALGAPGRPGASTVLRHRDARTDEYDEHVEEGLLARPKS
mmetsp:Transcript_32546/g.71833  ORF Transcript_32546/g.71833 Transcript_32546/m.71833 type:complete len:682 (+) Transcript_32546:94-2139(+)